MSKVIFSGVATDKNGLKIILLRGGPNSGKTTIGRLVRDYLKRAVSIPVNTFHRFINRSSRTNKGLAFKGVINLSEFFLGLGYSVIIEDVFIFKKSIDLFFDLGRKINVPVYLFELGVSSETALNRNRKWGPPLIEARTRKLFELIKQNYDSRAIKINAEDFSVSECADKIFFSLSGR